MSKPSSPAPSARVALNAHTVRAAIFDLDGVITCTATLHFEAWRDAVAEILPSAAPLGAEEYRARVDGRSRADGAAHLAGQRGAADEAGRLADRKNALYRQKLEEGRAALAPGAQALLSGLRRRGILTGLFTASRNASSVLGALSLKPCFDAVIDGETARRERLASKPAPDLPRACAGRLGVRPDACAGFEDAAAGIEALAAAGVGMVVGIAGDDRAAKLRAAGAGHVVPSLAFVGIVP